MRPSARRCASRMDSATRCPPEASGYPAHPFRRPRRSRTVLRVPLAFEPPSRCSKDEGRAASLAEATATVAGSARRSRATIKRLGLPFGSTARSERRPPAARRDRGRRARSTPIHETRHARPICLISRTRSGHRTAHRTFTRSPTRVAQYGTNACPRAGDQPLLICTSSTVAERTANGAVCRRDVVGLGRTRARHCQEWYQ
jgi:hypothetical protein